MSARIIKPKEKWHSFAMRDDGSRGEITVVNSGKRNSYLHIYHEESGAILTFTGPATIRKFARAILNCVGDEP